MVKQLSFILLTILFPVISTAHIPSKWNNPIHFERMKKREILSFTTIDKNLDKKHLKMEGAGITKVSPEKAIDALWITKCWEKHVSAISKITLVKQDENSKIIDLEASVLRLFWLNSRLKVNLKKEEKKMDWEFIEGDFKGMTGSAEITPKNDKNIVSFRNDLFKTHISVPKIVIKVGLNLAIKQAGWSLRKIIESDNQDPCLTSIY